MTRITSEDRTAATAYAMGERAAEARLAEAAAPAKELREATAPAEGLDVERLARAITANWTLIRIRPWKGGGTPLAMARALAAEYARLLAADD